MRREEVSGKDDENEDGGGERQHRWNKEYAVRSDTCIVTEGGWI